MAKKTPATATTSTPASTPKTPAAKTRKSSGDKTKKVKVAKPPRENKPRVVKPKKVCPPDFVPAKIEKGKCPFCGNFMKTEPGNQCKRCGYKFAAAPEQTTLPVA